MSIRNRLLSFSSRRKWHPLLVSLLLLPAGIQISAVQFKSAGEIIQLTHSFLIRFRPLDISSPGNTLRMDLLIGRRLGSVNLYAYWKSDSNSRHWLGTRADATLNGFKNRLAAVFQLRAFTGINGNSPPHFYFINGWFLRPWEKGRFRPGFLGFGKKIRKEDAVFFFGPAAFIDLSQRLSLRISFGDNLLGEGYLLYFKLNYDLRK